MTVKSTGKDGAIGIGMARAVTDHLIMPGWKTGTYGYHGDDGRRFGGKHNQFGHEYGPVWAKDDVVGCGFDWHAGIIFFTHNKRYIGAAFESVMGDNYFPCVGLHTPGAKVKLNFGQEAFAFDIYHFEGREHY
eukprot:TRINITY_DN3487_c0_g1_i2.p2 TRINITY_DN3487_c0_g1~~TRINITY_DN3487_c0_g1_i2.p2  ORF type:complete len:133 (-),score=22.23 TRINITY_DN3487_c0_g1_i2:31-429(-)